MKNVRLKPIKDQVVFITGASSGIGLCTAKMAAKRGARVMLVSRGHDALKGVVDEIRAEGGVAEFAVADVANMDEMRAAAEHAVASFGGIDTWVNNAGVSIYGRLADVDVEDDKRLFETNFWGVVNGSRLALQYLKSGGALINIGSVVSEAAIPIQGMYSASKHAVLGFTDALRMEVEEAGLPIVVTLVKPSAMDTPYTAHAKNYLEKSPDLPPPIYATELAAEMILHGAVNPSRDLYVGGGGRMLAGMGKNMPRWMDWFMERFMFGQQQSDRPAGVREGALHQAADDARERGDAEQGHWVRKSSVYNLIERHPQAALIAVGAIGAAAAGVAALLLSTPKKKESWVGRAADAASTYTSNGIHTLRDRVQSYR